MAVSGGIDSALALAIAVDALGAGHVSAFNMPSKFNTETTRAIAEQLARALGVRYGVIPIQGIADAVRAVFEEHAHPIARSFTRENLQARIRGILMMAESNDTGALLISCGNETEIALGYATLYGDMCGGISLIGDLSKTDVYRLARYVNRRHGAEMIPEDDVHIVPSAELADEPVRPVRLRRRRAHRRRDGRAPDAARPSSWRSSSSRELDPDRFLPDARRPHGLRQAHGRDVQGASSTTAAGRMRRSVYKRLQGPPIVAVSERAFGFDLRETIINGWTG